MLLDIGEVGVSLLQVHALGQYCPSFLACRPCSRSLLWSSLSRSILCRCSSVHHRACRSSRILHDSPTRHKLQPHPPRSAQKRPTLTANGSSDLPHVLEVRSDVLASSLGDCPSALTRHHPPSSSSSPKMQIYAHFSGLPAAIWAEEYRTCCVSRARRSACRGAHHVERCFCGVNEKATFV